MCAVVVCRTGCDGFHLFQRPLDAEQFLSNPFNPVNQLSYLGWRVGCIRHNAISLSGSNQNVSPQAYRISFFGAIFRPRGGSIYLGFLYLDSPQLIGVIVVTSTHPSVGPDSGRRSLVQSDRLGGPHMPLHSYLADRHRSFACSLCNESVELETAKTDERGEPVHEECYVKRVCLKRSIRPPPEFDTDGNAFDDDSSDPSLAQAVVTFLNSADHYPIAKVCPRCGSNFERRECSMFYAGRTWKIRLQICRTCDPESD